MWSPKSLEDYEQTSLESLTADPANLTIPHNTVTSLEMRKGDRKLHWYDFMMWLQMRKTGHKFQVYEFVLNYKDSANLDVGINFYMVPLGAYFKPRRETQSRDTILREYAIDALETFQKVLPARILSPQD